MKYYIVHVCVLMITMMSGWHAVRAYRYGAPDEACDTLFPAGHETEAQDPEKIPYDFHVDKDKYPVEVTISTTDGTPFMGFIVQSRNQTGQLTGDFAIPDEMAAHHLVCDEKARMATVTHSDDQEKKDEILYWYPPEDQDRDTAIANVQFFATIVKTQKEFWLVNHDGKDVAAAAVAGAADSDSDEKN